MKPTTIEMLEVFRDMKHALYALSSTVNLDKYTPAIDEIFSLISRSSAVEALAGAARRLCRSAHPFEKAGEVVIDFDTALAETEAALALYNEAAKEAQDDQD